MLQEVFNRYGGLMMDHNEKLNHLCMQFSSDIHMIFNDVLSIILFGSAVTAEYNPKKSDLNFLVVLGESDIRRLNNVQKFVKDWQKEKISLPLFLTKSYIKSSLDSFPIEFLNMQSAYRLIDGEDVLKDLKISKKDIRLQCERELKGKLLKLRQGYILTGGKNTALKSLISQSIVTFTAIFKALLYLQEKEIPKKKTDVILKACDVFDDIDRDLFTMLLLIHHDQDKKSKHELESILQQYIQSISRLSETVDRM
ncbi:hypothetical protein JW835_13030 [bacterium]|nr:hypothetical protein [bacterium]